jgi:hypothetical protein
LLVRDTGGGRADLARKIVIGSHYGRAAGCPFRYRPA